MDGGELVVAAWGEGPRTVLGIHGITASSMSLAPVARHLGDGFTLLAPDLRGRGGSASLPGPYGMGTHAADCAAVIEALGAPPAVVLGESMGGFVAVELAASRPDLVRAVVLADGGIPAPVPPGIDPDAALEATLGPALERLSRTFPSREAYHEFWRAHPAFAEEWSTDIAAYLDYDLEEIPGGFRSRVSEDAIRADGRQLLGSGDSLDAALASLTCPVTLLRAPSNLLAQPVPLIPDELVAMWSQRLPQLTDRMVEGTNHYTLVLGEPGAETLARATAALAPAA